MKKTLGVRNKNPFNIRSSKSFWVGKIGSHRGFEVFDSFGHGLRAGLKLLANYVCSGRNTPVSILSRFAPPSENNTSDYIDFVCSFMSRLGYSSSEPLLPYSPAFFALAAAICKFESNYDVSIDELQKIKVYYKL